MLKRKNRTSKRPITEATGPVLSLTTYGKRVEDVYQTIESIAAGRRLPSRVILWLDEPQTFRDLPDTLKRLEKRGLEVRLTENLGPHTKYFPTLDAMTSLDEPLVIGDDDMLYPQNWLSSLLHAYRENPGVVNCHRAHTMTLVAGKLAPYKQWESCTSADPSWSQFATGVSGIILPPLLLQRLRSAGKAFQQLCPKADDIWLNVNALRAGLKTKQIRNWQRNYPMIPGTQDITLSATNVHDSQNDVQIAKTYTEEDIFRLRGNAINP